MAASFDIYGNTQRDRYGLAGNPWAGIIDVPRGKEYLYKQMPPPGGFTAKNPAVCFSNTGHEVEVSYERGKKKLKRIRLKKDEERKVTKEEALEDTKKMFKYLKQYNKAADLAWEQRELAAYDSG
jgi:hypothetical protein